MHCFMRNNIKQVLFGSKHLRRTCNSKFITTEEVGKVAYNKMMQRRQQQAKRSIVVQVQSEKSFPELYNCCASFGQILSAHHYYIQHEDEQHYILFEFASSQEASAAISASVYNDELTGVPAHSPFLWFRATSGRRALKNSCQNDNSSISYNSWHCNNKMLENASNNLLIIKK